MNTQQIEQLKDDTLASLNVLSSKRGPSHETLIILKEAVVKLSEEARSAMNKASYLERTTIARHYDTPAEYVDAARIILAGLDEDEVGDSETIDLLADADDTLGCAHDRLTA